MKVHSEFDPYLNMSYIELGAIGGFCLDNGCFLPARKMTEQIDELNTIMDRNDQVATKAIDTGDLDILAKSNDIDNSFGFIIAKLALEFVSPNYRMN